MQLFHKTKKVISLTVLLAISTTLFAIENAHAKARESFIIAGSESCKASELLQITETDSSGIYVIQAYKGAAYTLMADCVRSPTKKMKNFNLGKEILDNAVTKAPTNPEIRFIRIMVQNGAPAFLNYNNLQEDMDAFIKYILVKIEQREIDDFDKKMAKILSATDLPDNEQIRSLNETLN